jgi:hypothetical protein
VHNTAARRLAGQESCPAVPDPAFLREYDTCVPVDPVALREHEARAWTITYYAPTVLPDLLLDRGYARALWELDPTIPDESIPDRLAVLQSRQEVVFRDRGPSICVYTTVAALMSEAVHHETAMAQRVHQVALLCRHPRLMFRIVAESGSPADRFALFETDDGPVIYVPGTVTELFLTAPSHVKAHQELFNEFYDVAWNSQDSRTFLAELTARDPLDVQTRGQADALAASFGFTAAD